MNHSKNKILIYGLIITFFIGCEGEEGAIGLTGLNSLVKITNETAGANCENSGIKVEVGIDNNSNGSLDSDEVLSTSYVCNGIDGNASLTSVTTEPTGINCENGGIKINTGIDINSNGTLDNSEIATSAYACNGTDGQISLVNITDEPGSINCENGGVKIDSGIDDNGDGVLDEGEIEVTRYVCDGLDGAFDEQIILTIWSSSLSGSSGFLSDSITGDLIKFDKRNWVEVDSIIFVPKFATGNSSVTAYAELYNQTDGVVIGNSTVNTSSTTISHIESTNIFSDLPESEVDLAIKLRTEDGSSQINMGGISYLILYRNK